MKSIQRTPITNLLSQSEIVFGDIDDRILLDFVKDPYVSIVKKEVSSNTPGLHVKY